MKLLSRNMLAVAAPLIVAGVIAAKPAQHTQSDKDATGTPPKAATQTSPSDARGSAESTPSVAEDHKAPMCEEHMSGCGGMAERGCFKGTAEPSSGYGHGGMLMHGCGGRHGGHGPGRHGGGRHGGRGGPHHQNAVQPENAHTTHSGLQA